MERFFESWNGSGERNAYQAKDGTNSKHGSQKSNKDNGAERMSIEAQNEHEAQSGARDSWPQEILSSPGSSQEGPYGALWIWAPENSQRAALGIGWGW